MASINPVYARIVTRYLHQQGFSEEEIFAGSGLSEDALWAITELPLLPFRQILENADRLQTDIPVGFLIGRHQNVMSLGPMGAAVSAAPSIRHGLQAIESFTRLHASYMRVALHSRIGGMSLRFNYEDNPEVTLIPHAEATLVFVQWYIETVSGQPLDDASYLLTYPAPAYAAQYQQYLHGTSVFGQQENSMELPSRYLDIRSPYYHEQMWQQSKLQLSQRLRELGATETGIYSQHVLSRLRSHEPPLPGLQAIASDLHVSERTLNRRLQSEGTSFRELRRELIHEWARQHLMETEASVESIAITLGYQDPANFRRAFRSRFGITPSDFRQSKRD